MEPSDFDALARMVNEKANSILAENEAFRNDLIAKIMEAKDNQIMYALSELMTEMKAIRKRLAEMDADKETAAVDG